MYRFIVHMRLIITRFPFESQLGGLETLVLNLALSLRAKGHSVSFVGTCPVLLELFKESDFQVTRLAFPKPPVSKESLVSFILLYPFALLQSYRLRRMLKKGDTVYMLSLGEKLIMTKMLDTSEIKVVWGEHESLMESDSTFRSWLYKNPFLNRYRKNSEQASVITVSPDLHSQFEKLGGIAHLDVIQNGVDTGYFSPSYTKKYAGFAPKDRFIIGTVARLREEKGLREFIEIARQLSDKIQNSHFIIAGEGILRKDIEQLIIEHTLKDRITLLGEIPYDQIRDVYNLCDMSIFLSKSHETFGLTALESMSMGRPTLVSKHFGFLTEQMKEMNFVIDPVNLEGIVSKIQKIHDNASLGKNLIAEQQNLVQSHFSLEKMVDQYERIFTNP